MDKLDIFLKEDEIERSLAQLQREKTIADIFRLILYEINPENNRKYSVEAACRKVGIGSSTWYEWIKEGHVQGPVSRLNTELNQMAYSSFIPQMRLVFSNMLLIAQGRPPLDEMGKKVALEINGSHVLKAMDMITKFMSIQPLNAQGLGAMSEAEHLESYQPQQVHVTLEQGDFVYNGQSQARMGELPSIANEIEGDATSLDISDTG